MTLAEKIAALVAVQPGLSEAQIAQRIYGAEGYPQMVNSKCRRLLQEGRIRREGQGYRTDPFTYHPPRIDKDASNE